MGRLRTLDDMPVAGKLVVLRADLNVPVKDGVVGDRTRIERIVPTLRELLDAGAAVVVLSHFGRPKGKVVLEMSLKPVVPALAEALGREVRFAATDWRDGADAHAAETLMPGEVIVLENTRFHPGEESNDREFARQLAKLGDVFVNDAFSAAHRAHASTEGIARFLPAVAGRAMQAEIEALTSAFENPKRPLVAVIGGAKISTKIELLDNFTRYADVLVIGGAMANTLLKAQGHDVGKSLIEADRVDDARKVLDEAQAAGRRIILPVDAVVADEFKAGATSRTVDVTEVGEGDMILDIGSATVAEVKASLDAAATLIWNGPLGAFEIEPFDRGTVEAAQHAARLTGEGRLTSVAGGGDTVAALARAGVIEQFSYVSTAGGAFLEWLEGKPLPGVKVLEDQESASTSEVER
ncbi:MAG TPA: phosphoglycerate kinase [Aestuariivirgaceae bacterium]|nr:phosphoglycerate kinase [Aestuariivirgaceae bacterium]